MNVWQSLLSVTLTVVAGVAAIRYLLRKPIPRNPPGDE